MSWMLYAINKDNKLCCLIILGDPYSMSIWYKFFSWVVLLIFCSFVSRNYVIKAMIVMSFENINKPISSKSEDDDCSHIEETESGSALHMY